MNRMLLSIGWLCCLIAGLTSAQGSDLLSHHAQSTGHSPTSPGQNIGQSPSQSLSQSMAQSTGPKPEVLFTPDMHRWWQHLHRQEFLQAAQLLETLPDPAKPENVAWHAYLRGLLAFEQGAFLQAWTWACTQAGRDRQEDPQNDQNQDQQSALVDAALQSLLLSTLVEGFRNGKHDFLLTLTPDAKISQQAQQYCWQLPALQPLLRALLQTLQHAPAIEENHSLLSDAMKASARALNASLIWFRSAQASPFIASLVLQSQWYWYNLLNHHQQAAQGLRMALHQINTLEQAHATANTTASTANTSASATHTTASATWRAWRVDLQGQLSVSLIRLEQFHQARHYLSDNIAITREDDLQHKAIVEHFNLAYVYRQLGQDDLAAQYYRFSEQQSQKQLEKHRRQSHHSDASSASSRASLIDMQALSRINLASLARQKGAAKTALARHLHYENHPFQPQYRYFELLVQLELARDEVALQRLSAANERLNQLLTDSRLLPPQRIEALLLLLSLQVSHLQEPHVDALSQVVTRIQNVEAQLVAALNQFDSVSQARPTLRDRYQLYFLQWQTSRIRLRTTLLKMMSNTEWQQIARVDVQQAQYLTSLQSPPTPTTHRTVNDIVARILMEAQSPQAWIQATQTYYHAYIAWLWQRVKQQQITKQSAAEQIFILLDVDQQRAFAGLQRYWQRYTETLKSHNNQADLQRLLALEAQILLEKTSSATSLDDLKQQYLAAKAKVLSAQQRLFEPHSDDLSQDGLSQDGLSQDGLSQDGLSQYREASDPLDLAAQSHDTALPALARHQAYLRFHVTDSLALAFLLLPDGKLIVEQLDVNALNHWAEKMAHHRIKQRVNGRVKSLFFSTPISNWLTRHLSRHSDITELVWSPDGKLHWVPLAAVNIANQAGIYAPLITQVSVIRTHSAYHYFAPRPKQSRKPLLDTQRSTPARNLSASLFALTDFSHRDHPPNDAENLPSASLLLRNWFSSLPNLPFTKREITQIQQLLRQPGVDVTVWLDEQATTHALLSESSRQADLLHIATHGFYHKKWPDLTGVVTADAGRAAPERGLLTLAQLLSQQYANQLVVLSGCETMLGELFDGVGMNGMTHGFLARGAGSTLGTIWQVLDKPTSVVQTGMYRELSNHQGNVPAALRASQLAMFNTARYRDPRYWAGFVYTATHQSTNQLTGSIR